MSTLTGVSVAGGTLEKKPLTTPVFPLAFWYDADTAVALQPFAGAAMTHERASVATYTDSDGVLQTESSGTVRHPHFV